MLENRLCDGGFHGDIGSIILRSMGGCLNRLLNSSLVRKGSRFDRINILQIGLEQIAIRLLIDIQQRGQYVQADPYPDQVGQAIPCGNGGGQNTRTLNKMKHVDQADITAIQRVTAGHEAL